MMLSKEGAYNKNLNWQDLVHKYGLHDQSHLVKEFIEFNQTNPSEYLKPPGIDSRCKTVKWFPHKATGNYSLRSTFLFPSILRIFTNSESLRPHRS